MFVNHHEFQSDASAPMQDRRKVGGAVDFQIVVVIGVGPPKPNMELRFAKRKVPAQCGSAGTRC